MFTAYVVIAVATAAANLAAGVADLANARFVLVNATELGLDPRRLPLLAWLKLAGAAGVVLGLFGVPLVGSAAAVGLVLFFTCAVVIHVRVGVWHNMGYPAACLALAVGTLVLTAATR